MTPAGRSFLFFLLFLGSRTLGQNGSKLSGIVTNAVNKTPVEYATLSLSDPGGKTISETITDAKGNFMFKNLPPGSYLLKAGSIGFIPAARNFSLPLKPATINIALTPTSASLTTVTVTGSRPLVENHLDKIVYNATNNL